ncbi:MAG: VWA domain-containing protein [Orrella sp.]|jgi:Ca-activated chloride channel homolog|uniref:VWA domain-containing protein n=1 Tax=Orrella sp. TaxID=1921583 RepID=UPI003BBE56EF
MHFIWPHALWGFLLIPLLVAGYYWLLKRQRKQAFGYSTLLLVNRALSSGQGWRRHVPPVLMLLAVVTGVIGLARPSADLVLPADYRTLVVAVDVSLSMLAEDVPPSRMQAAQSTVKTFISDLPKDIRVGLVTFAGTAQIAQRVTDDRTELLAAVDRFRLQRATATGSGLLLAMAVLRPELELDIEPLIYGFNPAQRERGASKPSMFDLKPVAPGSYQSGAIVLISDGRRTTGPDPIAAAQLAAQLGIRVFTVAFGTPDGFIPGFDGRAFYAAVDERTLQAMALLTEGEFFKAENAEQMASIYEQLSTQFALERSRTEVSALFAAASALLVLFAAMLSVYWFRRRDY